MKLDANLEVDSLATVPSVANAAENMGVDAIWSTETRHDPFLGLSLVAEHTTRMKLGTGIALAFTRSPMTIAYTSWDLQRMSNGRFILGLGTQVKGHVERRFGVKWEPPAAKMREVITLLRAIWKRWQRGEKLDFRGRYYSVNLMTPFFDPGPISKPEIPIFVAAVNESMCRLAGELCQGLHVHPFHTVRYLKEVVLPAVEDGSRKAGRHRTDIDIAGSIFVAPGDTREEIQRIREVMRQQIAFYGATRTYRRVLDLHGWGEVSDRLHAKSVSGDWHGMPSEISEAMLDEFVLQGRWDALPDLIKERYNDTLDRVRLYLPFEESPNWRELIRKYLS